jgi:LysM repeat protein
MPWNLPREDFTAKQSNPPQRKDAIGAKPMNNPNPFIPQGSVLEQNRRRSRMKLGVFCVLAAGVCCLTAMLIQGCKKEQTADNLPPVETNPSPMLVDTNPPAMTNPSPIEPMMPSNPPPVVAPVVPAMPAAPAAGTEYVVVKGDYLAKIARNNHVTLKALQDANPGVVPTKLKVGQKLTIPAGANPAPMESATAPAVAGSGGEVYIVKSGDTLTKIARTHGTTVKAIESANNLSTTRIKVGQKLKLPVKAEVAAPVAAPAPAMPALPALPAMAPSEAPAPTGTPAGQ